MISIKPLLKAKNGSVHRNIELLLTQPTFTEVGFSVGDTLEAALVFSMDVLSLPYSEGVGIRHAYFMAELCAASYRPEPEIDRLADNSGFTVLHLGRERDFETQIYDTPYYTVIIFTGSNSWWDWLCRNLDWRAEKRGRYVLKKGALKEVDRIFDAIDSALPRTKPVLIGGHSAGGEAAVILRVLYRVLEEAGYPDLPSIQATYLFAPERGMSWLSARRLNEDLMAEILRCVAFGDWVHKLPPALWRLKLWKSGYWPLYLTGEPGIILQVPEAIPAWRPIGNHHIQHSYCGGLRKMCGASCRL